MYEPGKTIPKRQVMFLLARFKLNLHVFNSGFLSVDYIFICIRYANICI